LVVVHNTYNRDTGKYGRRSDTSLGGTQLDFCHYCLTTEKTEQLRILRKIIFLGT
jgi:hypothetical protein